MAKKTLKLTLPSLGGVAAVLGALLAVPGGAQTSGLAVTGGLERGEWTLTFRDGSPSRLICVRDGSELIQLQHPDQNCSQFVIEDNVTEATVQYTCRGNGYGRTTIRRETGSLIQIDSQGIVGGRPFELSAEGRRTGTC